MSSLPRPWLLGALLLSGGCEGPLSALDVAGRDAARIATLFWWMLAFGVGIWVLVMALALYAIRSGEHGVERARFFIVGGGAVLPVVMLSILLIAGLRQVPELLAAGNAPFRIRILGEQWWWRVEYELEDGRSFELANELRLPVGVRASLELQSADVVHSFWVPSLAGKVDLIPGRSTRLAVEPLRTGTYEGVCAEYCGVSHAKMMLRVVVTEAEEFEAWAQGQLEPAAAVAQRMPGAELFRRHGCAACHRVRGTVAKGKVGPDLTHVGQRVALGAGILPNDAAHFALWLRDNARLKPGVHMPAYDALSEAELRDLSLYLEQLQ